MSPDLINPSRTILAATAGFPSFDASPSSGSATTSWRTLEQNFVTSAPAKQRLRTHIQDRKVIATSQYLPRLRPVQLLSQPQKDRETHDGQRASEKMPDRGRTSTVRATQSASWHPATKRSQMTSRTRSIDTSGAREHGLMPKRALNIITWVIA
jgi:hypothetical protein